MRRLVLVIFCLLTAVLNVHSAFAANTRIRATGVDLSEFQHVDPRRVVPDKLLIRALAYLKKNAAQFPNQDYLVVIDFTKHSSQRRFFLINLRSGKVERYLTTHGSGSDPRKTGWAVRFSNRSGSNASSVGFYRVGDFYVGKHGWSLRLHGLSNTNSNAFRRAVVIHAAPRYVSERRSYAGRSWGCPALDPNVYESVADKIAEGALLYIYGGDNPRQF